VQPTRLKLLKLGLGGSNDRGGVHSAGETNTALSVKDYGGQLRFGGMLNKLIRNNP
jgi:hypothetical protein